VIQNEDQYRATTNHQTALIAALFRVVGGGERERLAAMSLLGEIRQLDKQRMLWDLQRPQPEEMRQQPGDDWSQTYNDLGYSWCRPCEEYHRLPECVVDVQNPAELLPLDTPNDGG
jgi:hypothetical protein